MAAGRAARAAWARSHATAHQSRGSPLRSAIACARAWTLQERMGKTPIRSKDSCGFIVNRFFGPWLAEAVRLLDEGPESVRNLEPRLVINFGGVVAPEHVFLLHFAPQKSTAILEAGCRHVNGKM